MDVLMLPPLMAVDSSNRFPEIKTHVKQVASYISFLFNTFYFNTWISSFDRWLILLTFTICTRRACRVDLYFQIGPRHKLTSETVKGHSPHMAQHGWIYHCRAARCMRQARAVPAYKTHPQLLIFAAVKKVRLIRGYLRYVWSLQGQSQTLAVPSEEGCTTCL